MEELTPEFFTSCGIEWRDDNPKQKECYEGDILVFIGGVEFTNTLSGGFGGEKN
ncbi:hypothetical protein LC612_27625 [Nostoc sp. CHAB 5834]|nr:hypothetical protein [Nostoc sp. CHAB 5834]